MSMFLANFYTCWLPVTFQVFTLMLLICYNIYVYIGFAYTAFKQNQF